MGKDAEGVSLPQVSRDRYPVRLRLLLWLLTSAAITGVLFPRLWARLGGLLSVRYLTSPDTLALEVLALLTLGLLWSRRHSLEADISASTGATPLLYPGLGLTALVFLLVLPFPPRLLPLQFLLAYGAAFTLFFGRAARIPLLAAGVLAVPFAVTYLISLSGGGYAQPVSWALESGLRLGGLPVSREGLIFSYTQTSGQASSFVISWECAGSYSMGFFLALFLLMMLDRPLPRGSALGMFALGIAGTWFQNLTRLGAEVAVGRYWGEAAFLTADRYFGYFFFLSWFGVFSWLYLKRVR